MKNFQISLTLTRADTMVIPARARLPNYSTDKLKIMGELMDNLEEMGVLAKPEEVGVVPVFVVHSLLMPKPGKGEWRLVSEFTLLNIHIRKLQNVAPTIRMLGNHCKV